MIFRNLRLSFALGIGLVLGAIGIALGQGSFQIVSPTGSEQVQVNNPSSAVNNFVALNAIRNATGYQLLASASGTISPTNAVNSLLVSCYLGNGLHGTFWPEGSIIVYPDVPNTHLEPLNRAAAINYCRWVESLPQNKTIIDIGDMAEAAVILAKDDRLERMTPQQRTIAAIRVAEGLKLKREGKNGMDLRAGDINRNFAAQSGGNKPPMLGAKMSDMSQLTPGMTRAAHAVTGPGANVRKAAPPLGGPPPGR